MGGSWFKASQSKIILRPYVKEEAGYNEWHTLVISATREAETVV
jgi:hypothetical protein